MLRFTIFLLLSFWVFSAHTAEIFKCMRADGAVIFKDKPCDGRDGVFGQKYIERPINTQDLRMLQGKFKRYNDETFKAQKRQTKMQSRAQRQMEQEQKRRLRLQGRCEKVRQQIGVLDQRYRHGYTAKQRHSLDRKLAECRAKKQKYCK